MKSAAKATVLTLEETSLVCIKTSAIAAVKASLLSSAQPARNHADSAQYFKELLIGTESIGSGTFGEVSFVASGRFLVSKRFWTGVHLLSSDWAFVCNQMCQQRSDGGTPSRRSGNCCVAQHPVAQHPVAQHPVACYLNYCLVQIANEMAMLCLVEHPFVVSIQAVSQDSMYTYLVVDLAPGGSALPR